MDWVVLDLEMTGLDLARDRICEVALLQVRDGACVESWSRLVRSGVPMEAEAQSVHGISVEMLAGAPRFEELVGEVKQRLSVPVWIAHGAEMDDAFLHNAFERCGESLPPRVLIDTLDVARAVLALPNNRLGQLAAALGCELVSPHRAEADATATLQVWQVLLDLVDPSGEMTLGELVAHLADLRPGSVGRKAQWTQIERAFANRESIWIRYLSRDEGGRFRSSWREVEVWKLRAPRLQGFCRLRGASRVFRLDRIVSLRPGGRAYAIPEFSARI